MKKRFLSIILVGVCIVALAGCASESTNENTDAKADVIADETKEIADNEENMEDTVKPEEDISAEDPVEETPESVEENMESEESNVLAEQEETKQPEQSSGTKNDTDNVISTGSSAETQQSQSTTYTAMPAEKTETTKESATTTTPNVSTTPTQTPAQTPAVTPTPAPAVKECEKSGNGKHQFVAGYKKPDCCNEGSNYEICSWCGLIRNETPIPKTEHDYYDWYYTTPTCDSDGSLQHTCRNCKEGGWGEVVPAYGHKWENIVTSEGTCNSPKVTVPTCTVCGLTQPEIFGDDNYNNHVGERLQGSYEVFNEETLEFETIYCDYCSACNKRIK